MDDLKITTLKELKKIAEGEIVSLPPFTDGTQFVVRMRRPSLMALVKAGKIPNELLELANELFADGIQGENIKSMTETGILGQMFDFMEILCSESMLEPSYDDVKSVGLELTDEQQMQIFAYAQQGVKALATFR